LVTDDWYAVLLELIMSLLSWVVVSNFFSLLFWVVVSNFFSLLSWVLLNEFESFCSFEDLFNEFVSCEELLIDVNISLLFVVVADVADKILLLISELLFSVLIEVLIKLLFIFELVFSLLPSICK